MDIIDQLFPAAQASDNVMGEYIDGQQPWQILQSVHNSTAQEVEFMREMKSHAEPNRIQIEVKKND